MFLALGVGAWSAAIFHFMTHAFFKALLFLGAGVVIQALDEEHDIFRMGGLRTGAAAGRSGPSWPGPRSLAAFPLITAGFYSKELILWAAWSSPYGSPLLWAAGWLGALLTSLYIFRLVFVVFFGDEGPEIERTPRFRILLPLVVLGILSVVGGLVETPGDLGGVDLFSRLLAPVLPATAESTAALSHGSALELGLQGAAVFASLLGIALAWRWYRVPGRQPGQVVERLSLPGWLRSFWFAGWGFDAVYDTLLVRPYVFLARAGKQDVVDWLFRGLAALTRLGHRILRRSQTGRLRWYARGVVVGAVALLGWVILS